MKSLFVTSELSKKQAIQIVDHTFHITYITKVTQG